MPRVPGALRGPGARCRLRGPVRCKASADEPKEASQPSVTVSGTQSKDPAPLPNLTDPVDVVQWSRRWALWEYECKPESLGLVGLFTNTEGGTLPEKRRLLLGGLAATGVALGGNFLGVTSFLLGACADDGRKTHHDSCRQP
eukprot:841837-Prorocentrum_minimum.AAC.3